jgi:photosystem II stability/assembly factor-like uncharacterized protein
MTGLGAFGVRVLGLLGIVFLCEAGADWKPIGPAGGGDFNQVFVSGSYLFASEHRGVWRSADKGVTWTCIQPGILPVSFLEVGSKLYETGTTLVSSDHGTTWKSSLEGSAGADSVAWNGIWESAFIGRYWVVTTRKGIYRSPDSGATWNRVANNPWPPDYQYNQVIKEGASLLVVNESGYYRSNDSGSKWEKLPGGAPGVDFQVVPMGRFLIRLGYDTTYRSSDFGGTWQKIARTADLFPPFLADGKDLYATGEADWASVLLRSSDSGQTWTEAGRINGNQSPISSLAFAGDTLYAGTYTQGVYRSFDRGAHFEQTSLASLNVVTLATNGKSLWAGAYGGGALFRINAGADGWSRPEVAVEGIRNISAIALDGEKVFAAELCCALHLSRDGGATWLGLPTQGANVNGVEAAAAKDGVLMLASNGCVYRLPDSASEWQRCVMSLPHRSSSSNSKFLVTDHAIFLGDSAGVFRSKDLGAHWDTVNHGLQGEVHMLAEGAGAIYAGGTQGVFRSEDQGDSWTRMNSDKTRFKSLAAAGRALFAGSDSGAYVSIDEGKNWAAASDGLTVVKSITSLAVFGENLYAGTSASIWQRPLSELAPVSVNLSGSAAPAGGSLDARVIRTARGPAIAFNVPSRGPVRLDLYDFSGRQVGALVDRVLDQGPAEAILGDRGLTFGGYILRLRADGQEKTFKIALTP